FHILACTVLKNKSESARSANTRNGRRGKVESNSFRKLTKFAIQTRFDDLKLLQPGLPIVPWLERDKEKSVVTGAREAEQTEANDAGRGLHSRCVRQDVFDPLGYVVCALERSRAW